MNADDSDSLIDLMDPPIGLITGLCLSLALWAVGTLVVWGAMLLVAPWL